LSQPIQTLTHLHSHSYTNMRTDTHTKAHLLCYYNGEEIKMFREGFIINKLTFSSKLNEISNYMFDQ